MKIERQGSVIPPAAVGGAHHKDLGRRSADLSLLQGGDESSQHTDLARRGEICSASSRFVGGRDGL